MIDEGHKETDDILEDLEERIKQEYRKAAKDTQEKLQAYLEKTEKGRLEQEALLQAGKITQKQYDDWVYRHTMVGQRWEAMRDTLAKDMHSANMVAKGMIKGTMPDVYALNMNFGTYDVEHGGKIDTGFTLYNHDTAEYLLGDERELMPGPSAKKAAEIAANKDMQWNKQHIQSAVLQGVLQGESPYDVAARLQSVAQMNATSAIRYARTMTTSAQNAGRYDAFRRAKKLGVDLTIEWQATLDNRTRHDHRMLHGQRRDVDEPFEVDGIRILYPAQGGPGAADIPQRLIWNCRCTLLSWVKGFEGDTVKSSPKMGDMSFEEWQRAHASKSDFHSAEDHGKVSEGERFNTVEDPMREVWGAAEDSHPEELKAILEDLQSSGVEVIRREGAIAYSPSIFPGESGSMLVEPGASFAAWAHEYKHFTDDRQDGYLGYRVFADPVKCAQRERDAYGVEIKMAEDAGRPDIADRLRELLEAEVKKYVIDG